LKRLILTILFPLFISACSMPVTNVRTVDARPGIIIAGAPDDALLIIDGLTAGKASSYNGEPNHLVLEPGTHRVQVQQGGRTLYDQQIFVDSETKRINIR